MGFTRQTPPDVARRALRRLRRLRARTRPDSTWIALKSLPFVAATGAVALLKIGLAAKLAVGAATLALGAMVVVFEVALSTVLVLAFALGLLALAVATGDCPDASCGDCDCCDGKTRKTGGCRRRRQLRRRIAELNQIARPAP
jgi:hypothetical protein